jgi:hypothetical protein
VNDIVERGKVFLHFLNRHKIHPTEHFSNEPVMRVLALLLAEVRDPGRNQKPLG